MASPFTRTPPPEGPPRPPRAPVLAALACLVLLAGRGGAFPAAPATPGRALTNVDIVRMTASGMPSAEIIEAIRRAATTAFDLDPDMITELKRADVADAVIEAMRDAQPRAPSPSEATGLFDLSFDHREGDNRSKDTAVIFAKDPNAQDVRLAFFVTCLEPTHVPDLWWMKSPLHQDFPRHRMLWFHEATRPYARKRFGRKLVFLELPEVTTIECPLGIHSLDVGVAARAGNGSWQVLAVAQGRLQVWKERTTHMQVHLSTLSAWMSRRLPTDVRPYRCVITSIDPPPAPPPAAEPDDSSN